MPIYQPSDDSYLLSDTIKDYLISLDNLNRKDNLNKRGNQYKSSSSQISPSSLCSFVHSINNNINNNNNSIKNIKILDMGSGSGIQAQTCKNLGFKNILTADINKEAVILLKKQGFKSIKSNLFSKLKKNKFDIIIFNPPYLPDDKNEPKDSKLATTAGKKGYEIIIKFIKQAKYHLKENGKILLLFSSLSKPSIIIKTAKKLGYNIKKINKKLIFFETLYVYLLELN